MTHARTPLHLLLFAALTITAFAFVMPSDAIAACTCQDSARPDFEQCVPDEEACQNACGCVDSTCTCSCAGSCTLESRSGDGGGSVASKSRELKNPLKFDTIQGALGGAIRIFTGISGSVALLMFVYGGVLMLTSGGSQDRITKGKKVLVWSTLGLAFIFLSYAILNTLFSALGA